MKADCETSVGRSRDLSQFSRLVIKVGSSLLIDGVSGRLNKDWLASLGEDLAKHHSFGQDIVVVSSGAIALGRNVLGAQAADLRLDEAQAAASIGQIALSRAWSEELQERNITAAQILLTLGDTEERRRYLNARATLGKLLKLRAIPIVNENDTVATTEIRYGDNDRLAARVAAMIGADALILLSDIDGLYSAPPASNPDADFIAEVEEISSHIEAMAGSAGSDLSRGGMRTKVEAGKIATAAGATMIIGSGRAANPLSSIVSGARSTWFRPRATPATARKAWIAGHLEPRGRVVIDAGALRALKAGRSLLPAGVLSVSGHFARGDAVVIVEESQNEIGRGLVAFDADEALRIAGRQSSEIEAVLGHPGRAEMIHRDDMVMREK